MATEIQTLLAEVLPLTGKPGYPLYDRTLDAHDFYKHHVKRDVEAGCTHYIALALGYWGKGTTPKEAIANCIKEGAKRKDKMILYMGAASMGVDGMGSVLADNYLIRVGEIS